MSFFKKLKNVVNKVSEGIDKADEWGTHPIELLAKAADEGNHSKMRDIIIKHKSKLAEKLSNYLEPLSTAEFKDLSKSLQKLYRYSSFEKEYIPKSVEQQMTVGDYLYHSYLIEHKNDFMNRTWNTTFFLLNLAKLINNTQNFTSNYYPMGVILTTVEGKEKFDIPQGLMNYIGNNKDKEVVELLVNIDKMTDTKTFAFNTIINSVEIIKKDSGFWKEVFLENSIEFDEKLFGEVKSELNDGLKEIDKVAQQDKSVENGKKLYSSQYQKIKFRLVEEQKSPYLKSVEALLNKIESKFEGIRFASNDENFGILSNNFEELESKSKDLEKSYLEKVKEEDILDELFKYYAENIINSPEEHIRNIGIVIGLSEIFEKVDYLNAYKKLKNEESFLISILEVITVDYSYHPILIYRGREELNSIITGIKNRKEYVGELYSKCLEIEKVISNY